MKYYHAWFQTKFKRRLLIDEIDSAVHRLFKQIAEEKKIQLLAFETLVDHAHLLIALENYEDLPMIIKTFKGISARRVFQEFVGLQQQVRINNFWARGYGFKEIPEDRLNQVIQYINDQKKDLHII